MKVLRLLCPLLVAIGIAAVAAPAQATGSPTIASVTLTSSNGDCSRPNVCVEVTVDDQQPGTIVLMLTGHTPSGDFVDTGAPHQTLQIDADHSTYTACFGDVTQFTSAKGFNTLRVEVASSMVPDLRGTSTKSRSFSLCGSTTNSGGGSVTSGESVGASPTPSAAAVAALAQTGGLDDRRVLLGLTLLVAGLAMLLVIRARGRLPGTPR